mmetsp:Transcript_59810/g.106713  ORF Transcript_59810/g.106713 Transcript_59810/m.106713 type:complete len:115 (+) Transcript_59810:928-1272(+)
MTPQFEPICGGWEWNASFRLETEGWEFGAVVQEDHTKNSTMLTYPSLPPFLCAECDPSLSNVDSKGREWGKKGAGKGEWSWKGRASVLVPKATMHMDHTHMNVFNPSKMESYTW